MRKKLIAGVAGVTFAAAMGVGMTQLAQAETPAPSPTTSAFTADGDNTRSGRSDLHGRGGNGFATAALATELGLPEDSVSDALAAARDQVDVDRPSSDATEAERDAVKADRQAAFVSALASELDIEEAAVTTAMSELQSEKEATKAAADKVAIDEAVTDGKLTQTEADAVQKAVDAGVVSVRGGGHHR